MCVSKSIYHTRIHTCSHSRYHAYSLIVPSLYLRRRRRRWAWREVRRRSRRVECRFRADPAAHQTRRRIKGPNRCRFPEMAVEPCEWEFCRVGGGGHSGVRTRGHGAHRSSGRRCIERQAPRTPPPECRHCRSATSPCCRRTTRCISRNTCRCRARCTCPCARRRTAC